MDEKDLKDTYNFNSTIPVTSTAVWSTGVVYTNTSSRFSISV